MHALDLSGHDLSQDSLALACRPARRFLVQAEFALQAGTLATLEGPVPYQPGDALLTAIRNGQAAERWCMPAAVFHARYELAADQYSTALESAPLYCKRQVDGSFWLARQMSTAFLVTTEQGASLNGQPGDWLVQHPDGGRHVVAQAVFAAVYELVPAANRTASQQLARE